jgi:hypothetical protein
MLCVVADVRADESALEFTDWGRADVGGESNGRDVVQDVVTAVDVRESNSPPIATYRC